MMAAKATTLRDDAARRRAIAVHDSCLLVEAGAGSGKTAVLAGRIAMLLAGGVAPKSIAAVTFTEFAASELLIRVRAFVGALANGDIPTELRVALPDGLSAKQRRHLADADAVLDELTCSTIHGFCQRLITPYPVEANMDPGAGLMDPDQAEFTFTEAIDTWLREELAKDEGGLLAELVLQDPERSVALIRAALNHHRSHRHATAAYELPDLDGRVSAFQKAVETFCRFWSSAIVEEPETASIVQYFKDMAEEVGAAQPISNAARLVRLLVAAPNENIRTRAGSFARYQKKGKWVAAARGAGLPQAEGARLNGEAGSHYLHCCEEWTSLQEAVATRVLSDIMCLVKPVMVRFRTYKRAAGLLDFDDLIFSARDLLRDHDVVRRALAARFRHVLVDEFQDTDLLQTEIFWRLCGDPPDGNARGDWTKFRLRPGALFLVGDPKQAIYRFRGADISAYLRAREAFSAQVQDGLLSITTNFRSCAPVIDFVNKHFETPLSKANGQPGFEALDPFQSARSDGLSVAALDIPVAGEDGKATAQQQRDGEAEAVAALCARLIGGGRVRDQESGSQRPCMAGDIALLAPTGSELWRYEQALEQRNIPVATQAGKGLYRRQEIQDLIALTRVLADQRDRLALGAFLRGPLVGLTEEELLDIVWALPRSEDTPDTLPRLDLGVNPDDIANPHAKNIIERLKSLRSRVNATTPYALLSDAVHSLHVRPILLQRHRGQAERALTNVDLYLGFSRTYAVRGMRAFSEAMTTAWKDETRAVEGRPDAQEEAVALYTMHASKGLEWPIVVPINTMTRVMAPNRAVADRATGHFYCPVFGTVPKGHDTALEVEKAELDRERVRLWYVTCTRARELLVLPRLNVNVARTTWSAVVDLNLPTLPSLNLEDLPTVPSATRSAARNEQTREKFAAEAKAIWDNSERIVWRAPSRDEDSTKPVVREESSTILASDGEGGPADSAGSATVQGGRERGTILHKLIEEVLNGETTETLSDLTGRAATLIRDMGLPATDDPAHGPAPSELADCTIRALSLPEIAPIKPRLVPEFPVYGSNRSGEFEEALSGIADAIAFGADGTPDVVVDWKSDVAPTPETISHYHDQVLAYLEVTGAKRGLIVLVTTSKVLTVNRQ